MLERISRPRANVLGVLTYHRIDLPERRPSLYPGLISATPGDFERQMAFVAANCRVVGAAELLEARRNGVGLPPRSVMITFDDAYRDFAEYAWPVLERLGLAVTLFVPTGYPDRPERAFWWDRLHQAVQETERTEVTTPVGTMPLAGEESRALAYRRLRDYLKTVPHGQATATMEQLAGELGAPAATSAVLGWEELRQLAGSGVTLAPHTRNHPLLDRVSADQARAEIAGSVEDLEREIGSTLPVFAYPSGQLNDAVVAALEEMGFEAAFTTARGPNDLRNANWLRLGRINITRRATVPLIRAQLLPVTARLSRSREAVSDQW